MKTITLIFLIVLIIGIFLFILGTIFSEKTEYLGKCYDKYGNEILNQTCKIEYTKENPLMVIGFLLNLVALISLMYLLIRF